MPTRPTRPTRIYATAFALSAALAVAGCSGGGEKNSAAGDAELFMQPVAAQGPDPFTDSTATSTATPSPVTRSPQPSPTGTSSPTAQGVRSLSGGTPGLYGGTHSLGSCDVGAQVRFLTADQGKSRAFAQASGISRADIPGFLRGLTPVVLRADTRVTNHGYRDGGATSFQSVLQTGTAVLVDNRGLPRVRCACGNPLKPPVALKGTPSHQGEQWSGYRPAQVVVVTPAPKIIVNITIVNIVDNTWIERKTGDEDGGDDHTVPPPHPTPKPTPTSPTPTDPDDSDSPSDSDTPSDSGTPSDSDSPDDSDTPGDSDTPSDGDTPGDSDSPSDSDTPSDSDSPGDRDATSTDCPTPSPATGTEPPTGTPSEIPPGCPTPAPGG
ncbi:DUF6777 domain-containing protein [Streptomyces sp. NPDC002853]